MIDSRLRGHSLKQGAHTIVLQHLDSELHKRSVHLVRRYSGGDPIDISSSQSNLRLSLDASLAWKLRPPLHLKSRSRRWRVRTTSDFDLIVSRTHRANALRIHLRKLARMKRKVNRLRLPRQKVDTLISHQRKPWRNGCLRRREVHLRDFVPGDLASVGHLGVDNQAFSGVQTS